MNLLRWSLATSLAAGFCLTATTLLRSQMGTDLLAVVGPATAVVGANLFLLPTALERGFAPTRCAAAAVLGAGIWLIATTVLGSGAGISIGSGVSVALMTYLLAALGSLLAPFAGSGPAALTWLAFFTVLAAGSPVWLGPLIALTEPGRATIDVVIALNPMTHLASGTQTDYLRSDWFYRHSPLGGLRYDYPSSAAIQTGYLVACLSVSRAAGRAGRRFTKHSASAWARLASAE